MSSVFKSLNFVKSFSCLNKTCTIKYECNRIYCCIASDVSGVRLDLTIVYAYIRCIDDFIDNEPDSAKNKPKYDMLKRFVDEMFADRNSDADFLPRPRVANIDWAQYRSHLTDVQMAIFRAMSRIVFYMPRKPFDAMLNGFSWDIEDRVINSEDDLWWYTDNVTGSIVEILSYSIMYRCDHESYDIVGRRHFVENTHMIGRVSVGVLILHFTYIQMSLAR